MVGYFTNGGTKEKPWEPVPLYLPVYEPQPGPNDLPKEKEDSRGPIIIPILPQDDEDDGLDNIIKTF